MSIRALAVGLLLIANVAVARSGVALRSPEEVARQRAAEFAAIERTLETLEGGTVEDKLRLLHEEAVSAIDTDYAQRAEEGELYRAALARLVRWAISERDAFIVDRVLAEMLEYDATADALFEALGEHESISVRLKVARYWLTVAVRDSLHPVVMKLWNDELPDRARAELLRSLSVEHSNRIDCRALIGSSDPELAIAAMDCAGTETEDALAMIAATARPEDALARCAWERLQRFELVDEPYETVLKAIEESWEANPALRAALLAAARHFRHPELATLTEDALESEDPVLVGAALRPAVADPESVPRWLAIAESGPKAVADAVLGKLNDSAHVFGRLDGETRLRILDLARPEIDVPFRTVSFGLVKRLTEAGEPAARETLLDWLEARPSWGRIEDYRVALDGADAIDRARLGEILAGDDAPFTVDAVEGNGDPITGRIISCGGNLTLTSCMTIPEATLVRGDLDRPCSTPGRREPSFEERDVAPRLRGGERLHVGARFHDGRSEWVEVHSGCWLPAADLRFGAVEPEPTSEVRFDLPLERIGEAPWAELIASERATIYDRRKRSVAVLVDIAPHEIRELDGLEIVDAVEAIDPMSAGGALNGLVLMLTEP